jgi:ribosomal protein S18 acetylase RimI-like enzyme
MIERGAGASGSESLQRSHGMVHTGRFGKILDCRIRNGASGDRDFVAELSRQVFSKYGDYERILPACLDDPQFHTLIGEHNDRSAGFCMLSIGDGIGEVVAVAVDPLWQGRGIGRALMQAIIEDARGMGIRLLVLKTAIRNLPAQGLFRRIGFEETGRVVGYYACGQTAIGMRMRL